MHDCIAEVVAIGDVGCKVVLGRTVVPNSDIVPNKPIMPNNLIVPHQLSPLRFSGAALGNFDLCCYLKGKSKTWNSHTSPNNGKWKWKRVHIRRRDLKSSRRRKRKSA